MAASCLRPRLPAATSRAALPVVALVACLLAQPGGGGSVPNAPAAAAAATPPAAPAAPAAPAEAAAPPQHPWPANASARLLRGGARRVQGQVCASSAPVAVLLSGLDLIDDCSKGALWSLFKGLVSGLLRTCWQPELFFCHANGNSLEQLRTVVDAATLDQFRDVPMIFSDTFTKDYQFLRSKRCYQFARDRAQESGKHFAFYIRARPDLVFGNVDFPLDLSTACVYARLRSFHGLEGTTCQTEMARHRANINCAVMDDQFVLVPAGLAEVFFAFGEQALRKDRLPHPDHKGSCWGQSKAEASLTGYVLNHRMGICPFGIAATRAYVDLSLNKKHCGDAWVNPPSCDIRKESTACKKTTCLPYDKWMAAVLR